MDYVPSAPQPHKTIVYVLTYHASSRGGRSLPIDIVGTYPTLPAAMHAAHLDDFHEGRGPARHAAWKGDPTHCECGEAAGLTWDTWHSVNVPDDFAWDATSSDEETEEPEPPDSSPYRASRPFPFTRFYRIQAFLLGGCALTRTDLITRGIITAEQDDGAPWEVTP